MRQLIFALGVGMAFLAPSVTPSVALSQSTERVIVVTGEGRIAVVPDMAIVSVGVTAQATSPQDAMDAVSADVRAIFQRVVDLGLAPRDVQTTTLRLDPVFSDNTTPRQGAREITGFVATNDVDLNVRDMVQLGTILQAVLDEGANRISSIRFTLADRAQVASEARRAAVLDANARASLYAEAAGVAVGDVVSIIESGTARPQMMRSPAIAMDVASVPVAAGALEVTAQVTVTYEISE